jgi:hypothetical protein
MTIPGSADGFNLRDKALDLRAFSIRKCHAQKSAEADSESGRLEPHALDAFQDSRLQQTMSSNEHREKRTVTIVK